MVCSLRGFDKIYCAEQLLINTVKLVEIERSLSLYVIYALDKNLGVSLLLPYYSSRFL